MGLYDTIKQEFIPLSSLEKDGFKLRCAVGNNYNATNMYIFDYKGLSYGKDVFIFKGESQLNLFPEMRKYKVLGLWLERD